MLDSDVMLGNVKSDAEIMLTGGQSDSDVMIEGPKPVQVPKTPPVVNPPTEENKLSFLESPMFKETYQGRLLSEYYRPHRSEISWTDEPLHEATKKALIDIGKTQGMNVVGAGELTMNLATSMMLYVPSKIWGSAAAITYGSEVAKMAEEEIARVGYEPQSKAGQEAAALIGKGFELFLTPARNAANEVKKLSPRAAYLVEFGLELAEFAMTGGLAKGFKSKLKPKIAEAKRLIDTKYKIDNEAIDQKLKEAEEIPSDLIRETQKQMLEAERVQAEIRYNKALESFEKNLDPLAAEELARKAEEVAKAKTYPVEKSGLKKPKQTKAKVKMFITKNEKAELGKRGYTNDQIKKMRPDEASEILKKPVELKEKGIPKEDNPDAIAETLSVEYRGTQEDVNGNKLHVWHDPVTNDTFSTENIVKGEVETELGNVREKWNKPKAELAITEMQQKKITKIANEIDNIYKKEGLSERLELKIDELADELSDQEAAALMAKIDIGDLTGKDIYPPEVVDMMRERFGESDIIQPITEIDLQTGSPEPETYTFENHPFREKPEFSSTQYGKSAATDVEELISPIGEKDAWTTINKSLAEINEWADGKDIDIERVRDLLTDMSLRKEEMRGLVDDFSTFEEVIDEAASWARKAKRSEPGVELYDIHGATAEGVKQLSKIAKPALDFMKEFRKSMKEKDFSLAYAVKHAKIDTVRAFIDQSESLLKILRKHYPVESQRIIDRQRSAVAGKGYGRVVYDQIIKEVYRGKSKKEVEAINAYSLARRFADIYGYRSEKDYKHQPGYGSTQATGLTSLTSLLKNLNEAQLKVLKKKIPEIEEIFGDLTPNQIAEVIKSGDALFRWHRKIVDDLVEAQLKSPEEGELLKAHDFRKFKTLKVEKLYDFDYSTTLRNETIKTTNSGVESLGFGSTQILEPDARIPLSEMCSRVYGSIANQAAKLEWKALADKYPNNGIVSTKKTRGWSPMPYFEAGKRKNIYFHPDAAKYLVTRSHDISNRLTSIVRGITLAPVTRSLAVGTSPIWSTFIGLPMDVIHSLFTAKVWEVDAKTLKMKMAFPYYEVGKGRYKKVYNPFLPVGAFQLGANMVRTLPDIYTRGPFFNKYMEYGGSMPFLSMRQGRYMKGTRPPGSWARFIDLLSYHGASMEMWVRAATADRVVRNRARERGMTYEEALNNKDIMYEAVHSARDRMDYNQGGWLIKAADQSGMIFLNAGVLGARTYWREAIHSPVGFATRTAQLGTIAAGITATSWLLYSDIMKDVPTEGNEKNAVFPLFPNYINFVDENGDTRHFYLKLRMDPGAAFAYKFFDALTRTYMYDRGMIDQEPDYSKLVDVLKQLGPVGVSLPPNIQMWYDYATNHSWWKNREMYNELGGKTLPWPKSREEGIYDRERGIRDPNISQLAQDVGGVTGLSPKRLQESASNVFPYGNEFVYLFGKAYEQAFSDVPKEIRHQHWMMTLAEFPGINKIIGVTRPGYNIRQTGEDPMMEATLESAIRNGKLDFLAENYYWKGYGKASEVDKYIDSFREDNVVDSLSRRRDFIEDIKSLPNRSAWVSMFHTTPEAKAKHFYQLYKGSGEGYKILDKLLDVGYLGDEGEDRFWEEIDKLKQMRQ